MKVTTFGMIVFFITTFYWFDQSRKEIILNASKSTEIKNLIDSIKTINKDKEHLKEYFITSLEMNEVIKNCNRCKKNKFIIID
jgi:translation initiation factor 2 beta subunit (eIF-2beta)/eIF-5